MSRLWHYIWLQSGAIIWTVDMGEQIVKNY